MDSTVIIAACWLCAALVQLVVVWRCDGSALLLRPPEHRPFTRREFRQGLNPIAHVDKFHTNELYWGRRIKTVFD